MSEISGFYKLTHEDWIGLVGPRGHNLSLNELKLYGYIRTLDPFGNKLTTINPEEVTRSLGFSRPTFYRAVARLQELDLIKFMVVRARVSWVKDKNSLTHETNVSLMSHKNSLTGETNEFKDKGNKLTDETGFSPVRQKVSPMRKSTSETTSQSGFQDAVDQEDLDQDQENLDLLSIEKKTETEKADFLTWIRTKYAKDFPKIKNLDAWVKKVKDDPKVIAIYRTAGSDKNFAAWWAAAHKLRIASGSTHEGDERLIFPIEGKAIPFKRFVEILPIALLEKGDPIKIEQRLRAAGLDEIANHLYGEQTT